MASLFDMKKEWRENLSKAEAIVQSAESANRRLSQAESDDFNASMAVVNRLDPEIKTIEAKNTILRFKPTELMGVAHNNNNGAELLGNGPLIKSGPKSFTHEYATAFHTWIKSGGQTVTAALYEGTNPTGGYAVPVITDSQIVPLAPPEMGIRKLATVLPTQNDIKLPIKATNGTAAAKAEGDGTGTNVFGGTAPTLAKKRFLRLWPVISSPHLGSCYKMLEHSRHL